MDAAALKKLTAYVQRAMDNSDDTEGAVEMILMGVFKEGVRRGAYEGYKLGYGDGKIPVAQAGSDDVGRRVVSRVAADVRRSVGG